MCYAAPGPRCSGHTKTALKKAEARVDEAGENVGKVWEQVRRGQAGDPEHRDATRAYEAAVDELHAARTRYDATPDGMRRLEDKVARSGGSTISGGQAADRLARARRTRDEQLAAYKAHHRKDPRPQDEDGPEQTTHPDPQVAAADEAHSASVARQDELRVAHEEARAEVVRWEREAARGGGDVQYVSAQLAGAQKQEWQDRAAYADARERVADAWREAQRTRAEHARRGAGDPVAAG